ncbi:MAG: response regulator transcription factor [Anaerolineales bacterium]
MRVLVADDQVGVRSAMRFLLEHEPYVKCVVEAADAGELADMAQNHCPDLVLIDWELPGFAPHNLLPMLQRTCSDVVIIALSGRPEARQPALDAGAHAFVSKGDPPERLLAVIRDVVANGGESAK